VVPGAPAALQPTKPGKAAKGAKGAPANDPPAKATPVAPSGEFKVDPDARPRRGRGRYQRGSNSAKFVWIGFSVLLAGALVAGVIYGSKFLPGGGTAKKEEKDEPKQEPTPPPAAKPATTGFPRRLLFVSISKYMYLNPLTASRDGIDLTKPAALRLAYDWRVPTEANNNQVFVLSDTLMGPEARLPMKNVVQGTYQEFFKTSRKQDRIVLYFGGHAIEKDGKAYIAPMEAEVEGEEWEKSMIPLADFYAELQKCAATQKVVIWDVCRYNPERGRVRPGSEPMSEKLYELLTRPPAGVQVVVTCKPKENAMEYSALRPDGFGGAVYSGSAFLDSMKFVAEPRNNRMPKNNPTAADPIPVAEWVKAIEKRTGEMAELAEKSGSGGKQTVAAAGAAPASLAAPNPEEKAAARFEFPQAPKGASQEEIKSVEREFYLPPLKSSLGSIGLADFPFPADVMKDYANDGVSLDAITKDKEKYAFRYTVLEALGKIREKWSPGAGATKLREEVLGPINDALKGQVRKEQEFWAIGIIELELQLDNLKSVGKMREGEPKRWQAHYDFALASVKARLAYMNEYNKVLGLLITESLPPLDPKLGQDGYTLVASETLRSGKDIKKMAEEAQESFQEITTKYKGTPWAIQAKQEKSVVLGLNWKPASLEKK
jgi:hypothetical protein